MKRIKSEAWMEACHGAELNWHFSCSILYVDFMNKEKERQACWYSHAFQRRKQSFFPVGKQEASLPYCRQPPPPPSTSLGLAVFPPVLTICKEVIFWLSLVTFPHQHNPGEMKALSDGTKRSNPLLFIAFGGQQSLILSNFCICDQMWGMAVLP